MKKLLSALADFYADAPVLIQILFFALLCLPFFFGGMLTRYLILSAGWDESNLLTVVLYSLPWVLLFGGFMYLLSKSQDPKNW